MNEFNLFTINNLEDHNKVLEKILTFFYNLNSVIGAFVSGSTANGNIDLNSDLDIGILIGNSCDRESVWKCRWDREIAPWFHRFDADHIKAFFVIYLFEPKIKADINLYIPGDLPSSLGAPYKIIWDKTKKLEEWYEKNSIKPICKPDWSNVVHEDERFWVWMFYSFIEKL
jgi:predicted nucleotidyltransferase